MTRMLPPLIPSLLLLATVWLQTASAAPPATLPGERLVVSRDGVIEPQFKVLILPFSEGEALPVLELQSKDTFGVRWPGGGAEEIGAVVDETGRSNLVLH